VEGASLYGEGWDGTFYPKGIAAREQLSYYAAQFDAVELDNTFYRTPTISTVKGWYAKTPLGFVFAAKVPQVIAQEKMLVDCEEDLKHFLVTMDELQEKKVGDAALSVWIFQRVEI
jgi:uncharacterized protein YecE (DUF72 family)